MLEQELEKVRGQEVRVSLAPAGCKFDCWLCDGEAVYIAFRSLTQPRFDLCKECFESYGLKAKPYHSRRKSAKRRRDSSLPSKRRAN